MCTVRSDASQQAQQKKGGLGVLSDGGSSRAPGSSDLHRHVLLHSRPSCAAGRTCSSALNTSAWAGSCTDRAGIDSKYLDNPVRLTQPHIHLWQGFFACMSLVDSVVSSLLWSLACFYIHVGDAGRSYHKPSDRSGNDSSMFRTNLDCNCPEPLQCPQSPFPKPASQHITLPTEENGILEIALNKSSTSHTRLR